MMIQSTQLCDFVVPPGFVMATVPQTCALCTCALCTCALCTYTLVPCILRRESCILCLVSSTSVENPLQISSFLTNKANFRKAQMNVNKVLTRDYGDASLHRCGENKPNTNPIKPNLLNAQMNVNKVLTKYYENESLHRRGKNKPNTNPKQTQSKPISPPPINTQSKTCQKPIMKSPAKILAKSREISGIETARPISDTLVMSHKVCFLLFLRNPPKILCTGGNSCMRNLLLCLYNFVFLTSFFHFQTIHFNLKAEIVYESR